MEKNGAGRFRTNYDREDSMHSNTNTPRGFGRRTIKEQYHSEKGSMRHWKPDSDNLGEDVRRASGKTLERGLFKYLPPGELSVLSPTANSATDEAAISGELENTAHPVRFIAGDLNFFPHESSPKKKRLAKYQGDAFLLPFKNGSFDFVFDKKGAVWITLLEIARSQKALFFGLLNELLRVTKPNGGVIIDALGDEYSGYIFGHSANTSDPFYVSPNITSHKKPLQKEPSTYSYLQSYFSHYPEFKKEFFKLYTMRPLSPSDGDLTVFAIIERKKQSEK